MVVYDLIVILSFVHLLTAVFGCFLLAVNFFVVQELLNIIPKRISYVNNI